MPRKLTRKEIENKYGYDESIWKVERRNEGGGGVPRVYFTLEQFWLMQDLFLFEKIKNRELSKLFNINRLTLINTLQRQFNFSFTSKEAIELQIMYQVMLIHGDRYSFENFEYISSYQKHCFTCKTHGDFLITLQHIKRGHGCNRCCETGGLLTQDEVIAQFKKIHGDKYDYSKVEYVNSSTKVIIRCNKHKEFLQTPQKHKNFRGCPKCVNERQVSQQHLDVEQYLKNNNIEIISEYRILKNPETNYYLPFDFYLPEHNIIIEVSGIQHYQKSPLWHRTQEDFKYQQRKDTYKRTWAVQNGYTFVEIPYCETDEQWQKRLSSLLKL